MLTKNAIKRIIKLSQVKSHKYFQHFDWESLLSLTLEPCYQFALAQEKSYQLHKCYSSHNERMIEESKSQKSPVDYEYRKRLELWFK